MLSAIVFLPLMGAFFSGVLCRKIPASLAQIINTTFLFVSAAFSYFLFYKITQQGVVSSEILLKWLHVGNFEAKWVLFADSLTAVMLIVVTTVSALVHLYAIGYMHHDHHKQRFMSYLSAFTFFMLMLVTSDNLLQLFFGWEGVGLCSYLLIGFWFQKQSACSSAIKAFVVNRVGDFAFALGIYLIYITFNSIEFSVIFSTLKIHANDAVKIFGDEYKSLDVICILLFLGAMGKSAQFGLHVWLPDAMEGPTPVSALIHAATMVTAGVFLVARFSLMYEMSEVARIMITYVGAFTCLFAATIAITQNDIKRIIAYSTCSQLGYMFFACGVSAYSAGIFHLMTHACFKALLFLSAGSVIHAMSDEQDIRKMGGIWKKIPITYSMFWVGSLALAGIYPFAGYFSKDTILEAAYASSSQSGHFAYWMGVAAAFLTAFYSWRLIFIAFHGKTRASKETLHHIHDSPWTMTVPLLMLAVGAIFAGIFGEHLGMVEANERFWHNSVALGANNVLANIEHIPHYIKKIPLVVGVSGIVVAFLFYQLWSSIPKLLSEIFSPIYKFLYNKWYIDEIYDLVLVRPLFFISNIMWNVFDIKFIDRMIPNGAAALSTTVGKVVNRLQSGYVYHYALMMIAGLVAILSFFLNYM
jgi:NADH-quinone oxidoreductase subunit L